MSNAMSMEERVLALETTVRRQRRLLRAWLAAGTALIASAQVVAESPKKLRARQLEVVNSHGQVVLVVGTDDAEAGVLSIKNRAGRLVHELGVDEGAALQTLTNAKGEAVIQLGSDAFGNGALETFNLRGGRTCFAGANAKGDGGIRVSDRRDQRHFYVGDDVRGNGRIELAEPPGRRLLR